MRKIRPLIIIGAVCIFCACHTAYNTSGHSWVKAKSTSDGRARSNKAFVASKTKSLPQREISAVPHPAYTSNTLTASTSVTAQETNHYTYSIPSHSQQVAAQSTSSGTGKTSSTKAVSMVPFGEPKCSQRTAFYLSLPPFGLFGFHRFYLGFFWIGVLQVLTIGGLGLWTIIDIIRIYKGTLAAKDHYIYRRTWFN